MKNFSVIIPAYNEERFIGNLLDSIQKVRYPRESFEVVVVNDGSTDRTAEIIRRYPGIRLIDLPENVGRYEARKKGAEAAAYPNLLFIDAHSTVDPEILITLDGLSERAVNGHVLSAENPGPFETFYMAIRRLVFPKFYQAEKKPFYLTNENFDSMPKGTGVLYIEKSLLFSAFQDLAGENMGRDSSDDIKLLRTIVSRQPILNHPGVKITFYSRASFLASIRHLYQRGPKFVDYYFNPALRNFWLVIVFPILAAASLLLGWIFLPFPGLVKTAAVFGLNLAWSLILARSVREVPTIFLMLPLCAMVFYAGILWGIFLKLRPH